jgi:hypothetical protein
MRVWDCVFGLVKVHGASGCCDAMYACVGLSVWACTRHMVSVIDCCEAMHACVGVCDWACTRHMVTVIAAKRCMCVLAAYVV